MSGPMAGGCICGAVRYRIDEDAPPCYACHCTDCQTQSGSAFAIQMPVWRSRFSIEGSTVSGRRTLPSGATGTNRACAACLTRLYTDNDARPGIVIVRAGTLDASASLVPSMHMWTRSKQLWIEIPGDARQIETQPQDQADWIEILELGRRTP